MHLEADAKMNVYETPEGTKASRLSLVQRKLRRAFPYSAVASRSSKPKPGNIEVLSRPNRQEPSEASAATDSA